MRSGIEGTVLSDIMLGNKIRYTPASQTLAGTYTIDDGSPILLFLDPDGANRTVLLPPESKGATFIIVNVGVAGFTLAVKEDSNTTTIATIGSGSNGEFYCNGTTWFALNGATLAGSFAAGSDATDRVTIKGFYKNPAPVSVTVPSIANDVAENIDSVAVNVASAFSIQPAVGDAIIAIPLAALPTDCLLLSAYVTATDTITVTFGSKEAGAGVTGAAVNFDFLVIDLT